jgi:hypothetical protein
MPTPAVRRRQSRVSQKGTATTRRRAFSRLLHENHRRGGKTPTFLTPAIDAFDRQVPMTRKDIRLFGHALREVMDIARDSAAQSVRASAEAQALLVMRAVASCRLSCSLHPLWAFLALLQIPIDHSRIAREIADTEGDEAAADYADAAAKFFDWGPPAPLNS